MLLGQFGIRYSYVGMRRFLYNNLLEGSGSLIYRFVYYVKTKVSRSEFNYVFSKTTRSIFLKWHIKLECLKSMIFFLEQDYLIFLRLIQEQGDDNHRYAIC